MKKFARLVLLTIMVSFCLVGCSPTYETTLKNDIATDNVTAITLDEATEVQQKETVVTFVVTDNGISVDSVVNISKFHSGAEADVVYLIRNESNRVIVPSIYFAKGRIDDYSEVDGQGYVDAPDYIANWLKVLPESCAIPSQSAQGYLVVLAMPNEKIEGLPDKFAFQVGVGVGSMVQLAVSPWWLVTMR